jgi:hypothetical protein
MPATSAVTILTTATALPVTILTRTKQVVSNQSAVSIFVGTSSGLSGTDGILIGPSSTYTFESGAPMWAIATVAQGGGAGDQTVVMELE